MLASYHVPGLITCAAKAAPSALILVEVRPGQTLAFADVERLRNSGAAGMLAIADCVPDLPTLLAAARGAASRVRGEIGPRLRLLGYAISASFESLLEVLVGGPPAWRASDWTSAVGESVRTLERRCAERWQVPSPRRWMELVRVIHAVQALQAHPEASVESALATAGFHNVRRARELVKRICGTSPATVRHLIGWYWIVENWCQAFWEAPASPGRGRAGRRSVRATPPRLPAWWRSQDEVGLPGARPCLPATPASYPGSRRLSG
jgi:hypothetical protein